MSGLQKGLKDHDAPRHYRFDDHWLPYFERDVVVPLERGRKGPSFRGYAHEMRAVRGSRSDDSQYGIDLRYGWFLSSKEFHESEAAKGRSGEKARRS